MPPVNQKGFSAILVVIFIVVLASLVLGGIYYYSELYQPAKYAKAVIPLFENLKSQIQISQRQVLKEGSTTTQDIKVLQDQQALFEKTKDELSSLKPPRKMSQLHQDFSKMLDLLIEASLDAQNITGFIIKAEKLYGLLKPEDKPKDPTVYQFIKFWEDRIAQAKIVALDLFQEKPPKADQLKFDKLKSTWQETQEGYEAALNYLKRQDPNILTSNVSSEDIPEEEKAKIKKADKLDEFLSLLENVARADAEGLIKFTTTGVLDVEELNQLGSKVDKSIEELKGKYQ